MARQDLYDAAALRVPLTAWDSSSTKSGVLAWTALSWDLNTTYQHPGWLHYVSSMYRLTREGRAALNDCRGPDQLWSAAVEGYKVGDGARKESLGAQSADAAQEVVHSGAGGAHALRALAALITAWRDGGSAFTPGIPFGPQERRLG